MQEAGHESISEHPLTKRERRRLKREQKSHGVVAGASGSPFWIWWVLLVVLLVGVVAGVVILAKRNPKQAGASLPLASVVSATDWTTGNSNAPVSLVEYSDFQCSACLFYHPWLKQLKDEFGDSLAFTYRYFPLRSVFAHSQFAAEVAEAAGRQGKFWEMHDLIFDKHAEWSAARRVDDLFNRYAESLGLNLDQFARDLKDPKIKEKIEADYQSGLLSGVTGTPTFFLNGERLPNPRTYNDFVAIITEALALESADL